MKCHTNSESMVTIYSCVQELAKHDLDGAELQGQVSKHVEVHHGNQASAGQRQAEEPNRPDTGEQTHPRRLGKQHRAKEAAGWAEVGPGRPA
jgi:hypothetical protein